MEKTIAKYFYFHDASQAMVISLKLEKQNTQSPRTAPSGPQ